MKVFANRLKDLMLNNGLTQGDIAKITGVSEAAVSGWIKGALPRSKHILNISKHFGLSPNHLTEPREDEITLENLRVLSDMSKKMNSHYPERIESIDNSHKNLIKTFSSKNINSLEEEKKDAFFSHQKILAEYLLTHIYFLKGKGTEIKQIFKSIIDINEQSAEDETRIQDSILESIEFHVALGKHTSNSLYSTVLKSSFSIKQLNDRIKFRIKILSFCGKTDKIEDVENELKRIISSTPDSLNPNK